MSFPTRPPPPKKPILYLGMGQEYEDLVRELSGESDRKDTKSHDNIETRIFTNRYDLMLFAVTLGYNLNKKFSNADKKSETWEAGYKRRVIKTTDADHKADGYNWRIKGKDRPEVTIKLYKTKPNFAEFKKQMKRVAGHEFG